MLECINSCTSNRQRKEGDLTVKECTTQDRTRDDIVVVIIITDRILPWVVYVTND